MEAENIRAALRSRRLPGSDNMLFAYLGHHVLAEKSFVRLRWDG